MANSKLLKEAMADAKAVKETALANAKLALEEAFTPRLQSVLAAKLQAEAQKEARFGRLGQAAQMKSAEDYQKFQINQMQPWETKYNLLAARAAQAAARRRVPQPHFANPLAHGRRQQCALASQPLAGLHPDRDHGRRL